VNFDWLENYAAVLFGLVAGTIAHFGSRFTKGEIPSAVYVIGFVMQLAVVGLFAASFIEWLELGQSVFSATITCIFAISSHEVVEWIKEQGVKRILRSAFSNILDDTKGDGD